MRMLNMAMKPTGRHITSRMMAGAMSGFKSTSKIWPIVLGSACGGAFFPLGALAAAARVRSVVAFASIVFTMLTMSLPQTAPTAAAAPVSGNVVRNSHINQTLSGLIDLSHSGTIFQTIQPGVETGIDI